MGATPSFAGSPESGPLWEHPAGLVPWPNAAHVGEPEPAASLAPAQSGPTMWKKRGRRQVRNGRRGNDNGGNVASSDEKPEAAAPSRRRISEGTAAARRRFLAEGEVRPADIPALIWRSWRRCAAYGLDMAAKPTLDILSRHRLREAQDRNATLLNVARGEMESLYHEASDASGIVILTDPQGLVLHRLGAGKFASVAADVALRPGATWDEATVGTNAIGAAIAERGPGSVIGSEHFYEIHSILSCSAAPIFDPYGGIAGVLDLSNASKKPQPLTLALVNRAAAEIEHALFENQFRGFEQMRFHTDPYAIGGPREGILAFEGDRIVGANRNGVALLDLEWPARQPMRFDELFTIERAAVSRNPASDDCIVETRDGQRLYARLQVGPKVHRGWSPDRAQAEAGDRPEPLTLPQILDRVLAGPLAPLVRARRIKAGQLIDAEAEEKWIEDGLVVVRSGRLRCFASLEGKELTLFTLDAGDALPIHAGPMFEVKKDGEVVVISGKAYQEIMQSDPDFARSAMPAISRMLQRAMRMTEDIVFRCVRYRLIRALSEVAERDGRKTREGVVLDAPPSAEEFAMQIGATRQSASTIIAELIRDRLIRRLDASAIEIPDLDRLKRELA